MQNEVLFFRYLPYFIYFFSTLLAAVAGSLVYTGLTTKVERMQSRIRVKNQLVMTKNRVIDNSKEGKAEYWLKKAQYPLGLNGFRYHLLMVGFLLFLTVYYVIFPTLINGLDRTIMIAAVLILILGVFALPNIPFSLFVYVMKRVVDYHKAKKHAEVFMLYDLLINEIEMMTINRINTYSILRNIKPYFVVLDKPLTMLLTSWGNNEGPKIALDKFSQELSSKEAEALIGVMKNLDDVDQETALNHLRGMHSMFVKTQIENYRRKKKVTTDILGIPIRATHFIIIINFLMVVVTMVSFIMSNSKME